MISVAPDSWLAEDRERVFVVSAPGERGELREALQRLYPRWSVRECETPLAAIAEIASTCADVIVVGVDADVNRMAAVLGGLREAAGSAAKLVLSCRPETEPLARQLLDAGAQDYVLMPLEQAESDAVFGVQRNGAPPPSPSREVSEFDTLEEVVRVVRSLEDRPRAVLECMAQCLLRMFEVESAEVVAEGAVLRAGAADHRSVLTAPLQVGGRGVGSLSLGQRSAGAFECGEAGRLQQLAVLFGGLLHAAQQQRHWRRLAMTDECTGLSNRRHLHERMAEVLARAAEECLPVSVLMFDVDNFKAFNDFHGHEAGDEVLRQVGELFRKHCREQDIVVRYGGDEFVVVFWDADGPRSPGSKHPDCALAVLERFRESLRECRPSGIPPDDSVSLTVSGGLATYPWAGTTLEALLARADEALCAAKRSGRNRVLVFGQTSAAAGISNDSP